MTTNKKQRRQLIARLGTTAAAVFRELAASLTSRSARLVPAGVVAVNRAQERSYSLVSA